jgi:glycosyltransferase involved in cell wall biosynthesis
MAAGLPVVAFDCPCGPSDIITPQEDGILVENGNVKKLGEAICCLIDNPTMRQRFGVKARENANRFSQGDVMSLWIHLFEQICRCNEKK